MEMKKTFVHVDREAIDIGMTSPDIMQWIRNEVARTYGPDAVIVNLSTEIDFEAKDALKVNLEIAVPEE